MTIKPFRLVQEAWALLILVFSIIGCKSNTENSTTSSLKTTAEKDAHEKTEVRHAKGFSIEYFDDYKIVKIMSPFEKSTDTTKYILVQRGSKPPKIKGKYVHIEIPVQSLALSSSMHIGLLSYLGSENILTGLSSLQYVFSPKVRAMIDSGKVTELGHDQTINEEKLVAMLPDLMMTTGSPSSKMEHFRRIEEAGIPVISNSEWVENTPLARAEWVKLMAALLNKEVLVNKKFAKTEAEYERLTKLANQGKIKPLILSGLNTKDVWFMPNGSSYMAQFIRDAGGDFPWQATKEPGSLPLSFESVYPIALKADYWVNVGFDPNDTRKSILGQDVRYADFKAYKTNKMYSCYNRTNSRGTNDFYETGHTEPEVILADLISIFHPELLPDHKLVYYKHLK